jgi:hypothetical protein
MTNREIEKRLDALENRIAPEDVPSMWVYFIGGMEPSALKGWRYEDQIFWREPDESDDALRDRVLSLTEKYKNPPNGQLYISIV